MFSPVTSVSFTGVTYSRKMKLTWFSNKKSLGLEINRIKKILGHKYIPEDFISLIYPTFTDASVRIHTISNCNLQSYQVSHNHFKININKKIVSPLI